MSRPPLRLYAIPFCCDGALMLALFAVTRSLAERHSGLLEMGLLGGGFMLAIALSTVVSGLVCDRVGRRPMMVTAGLVGLVAIVACHMVFEAPRLLAVSYLLVGASIAAIYPPLMAWLMQDGDTATVARRHTTRRLLGFCASWNLGIISAHAGGGMLFSQFGPAGPLATAAALTVAATVLSALPATGRQAHPTSGSTIPSEPVEPRPPIDRSRAAGLARLCWVANLGGTFAMSIVFNLFPRLAVDVTMTADAQGMVVGLSRALVIVMCLAMHVSAFWHYRFGVALAAQAVAVAGLVVIVFAGSPIGFLVGLAGVAVLAGYNYFASMYYSAHGSDDHRKGMAMGLHEATLATGLAGGALAGGLIGAAYGPRAPYALAAGVVLVLAVVQIALHQRHLAARADAPRKPARALTRTLANAVRREAE